MTLVTLRSTSLSKSNQQELIRMKVSKISDESKALHKLYRDGEIDEQTLEDSMNGLALF